MSRFVNAPPIKLLTAAVTEGLIISLQGNVAAGAEIVDAVLTKCITVKDIFGYKKRKTVGCITEDVLKKEGSPACCSRVARRPLNLRMLS